MREVMTSFAKVVNISMDHDGSANNRVITRPKKITSETRRIIQFDQSVNNNTLSDTFLIGNNITQVTNMTNLNVVRKLS